MTRSTLAWLGTVGIVALLPAAALAQPYPITTLVTEGQFVSGVGAIASFESVNLNDHADWIVEADTWYSDTDADAVVLRNGVLYLREGDPIGPVGGMDIDEFGPVTLNSDLDTGWYFRLTGPSESEDSGIFLNTTLEIQEGERVMASGFPPGTEYGQFWGVRTNDLGQMAFICYVWDPAVPGSPRRAVVRLGPDGTESKVVLTGDLLPGQDRTIASLNWGHTLWALNDSGSVLYYGELAGDPWTAETIWVDHRLLAQEGHPSPVPDHPYKRFEIYGRDLNNLNEVAFHAEIEGPSNENELIVVEDLVLVREGQSLQGTNGYPLDWGGRPDAIRIDDGRNVLWFGAWDDPDPEIDTGLFLNDLLLVQEGVTTIDGMPVRSIDRTHFNLSDNGRFAIFEAEVGVATSGIFMIEIDAPNPVPDGNVVPGSPMLAAKNVNGSDIDVTWDVGACPADDYNLFMGDLADVSSYAYVDMACGLGVGGQATFTPLAGDTYWIVAGMDVDGVEGSHGYDSHGRARRADAGGQCAVTTQIRSSACP